MSKVGATISMALATLTMAAMPVSAQTRLKVDGSTGAMPLVAALAKAYEAKAESIQIEIGKGLGHLHKLRRTQPEHIPSGLLPPIADIDGRARGPSDACDGCPC
jgi:hypothetical protein